MADCGVKTEAPLAVSGSRSLAQIKYAVSVGIGKHRCAADITIDNPT